MTDRMVKLGRIARKAVYYLLKYTFMAILLVRSLVYGVLSWLMPDTRVDRFVKASGKALVDGVSMINYAPLDDGPLGSDDDAYPERNYFIYPLHSWSEVFIDGNERSRRTRKHL